MRDCDHCDTHRLRKRGYFVSDEDCQPSYTAAGLIVGYSIAPRSQATRSYVGVFLMLPASRRGLEKLRKAAKVGYTEGGMYSSVCGRRAA